MAFDFKKECKELYMPKNKPEIVTVPKASYIAENGLVNEFSDTRIHHKIYLSDAREVMPEKQKTVIRHPIRKA